MRFINRYIGRGMARAAATQNTVGEKVGVLNKLFGYVYLIRLLGKRIKEWNKTGYYVMKWTLLYWLFVRV